jgi:hypothetical protein
MDQAAVLRLRKAVAAARRTAHQAKLESCDVDDIDEAIQAADRELAKPTPNKNTLTMYLNSVARSLMTVPSGRNASKEIDKALRSAGLHATWEQ